MNGLKSLSRNYEEVYERVSIISQQTKPDEIPFFADLVQSEKKLSILDLGCGEGKLSILLAIRGHNVTAADISEGFLNHVRHLAKENSVNLTTVKGNIEEGIPNISKKFFDVIYLMDVIEHLKNPVIALENIREILRDDGILFIHTPNVCSISRFLGYVIDRKNLKNYYEKKNLQDLHFQRYDYRTLEQTLNFVGLKTFKIIPTKITIPLLCRFNFNFLNPLYRLLSREFPFLSDTLLLKCKKEDPIDIEAQIKFWESTHETIPNHN